MVRRRGHNKNKASKETKRDNTVAGYSWRSKMNLITLITVLGLCIFYSSGNDTGLAIVEAEDENQPSKTKIPDVTRVDASFRDEEDYNDEPFIPTKEWQVVKKGQSIPAGLHIRMNFQTHVREAKLLDGDDGARFHLQRDLASKKENTKKFPKKKPKSRVKNGPKVILGDDLKTEEQFSDPDKLYFTKSHLKEALKDFRDKFHDDKKMTDEQDVTRAEAVKKKFRSIEEIRKELGDSLGMQVKSDAQIMKLKLEVLKASNATESEQLTVLEDLEYYVHQIDNAVDLEKMNGFKIVIQYLNHSTVKLQEKAAKVIGSAVQSNPRAQAAALKHGSIPLLLRLISYASTNRLRKTAAFALSALIRNYPDAQVAFLKLNGLSHVLKLVSDENPPALRIKAVTLVSDLIVEQEDVKDKMVKNGKMEASERTPFMKALIANGWCEILPGQLETTDNDRLEKLLSAILTSSENCRESFLNSDVKSKLNDIKEQYENEITKEEDPDLKAYLKTFPEQVDKILDNL